MANGIASDIFKTRKDKPGNLDQFLIEEPDKPEFDQNRADQLRRLSAVSALGEGISGLVNAAGLARNENTYQPVQTGVANLGVQSFNEIANMNQQQRRLLEGWRRNVLDIRSRNKELSREASQQEKTDDAAIREQYYNAALRMISAGELDTARTYLRQAGLDAEQAEQTIRTRQGKAPQPTVEVPATDPGPIAEPAIQPHKEEPGVQAEDKPGPEASAEIPGSPEETDLMGIPLPAQADPGENADTPPDEAPEYREEFREYPPALQEKILRSTNTLQTVLETELGKAPTAEARERMANEWLKLNKTQLRRIGIPENRIEAVSRDLYRGLIEDSIFMAEDSEAREEFVAEFIAIRMQELQEAGTPEEQIEPQIAEDYSKLVEQYLALEGEQTLAEMGLLDRLKGLFTGRDPREIDPARRSEYLQVYEALKQTGLLRPRATQTDQGAETKDALDEWLEKMQNREPAQPGRKQKSQQSRLEIQDIKNSGI